jgi:hypothetical protein
MTKPQAHNPLQIPTLGGYFQAGGLLMALNELSGMIGCAAFGASRLVKVDPAIAKQVASAAVELLRNTGGIDVLSVRSSLDKSRTEPSSDEGA